MSEFATLDEVKHHLRYDDDDSDEILTIFFAKCRKCGQKLHHRRYHRRDATQSKSCHAADGWLFGRQQKQRKWSGIWQLFTYSSPPNPIALSHTDHLG